MDLKSHIQSLVAAEVAKQLGFDTQPTAAPAKRGRPKTRAGRKVAKKAAKRSDSVPAATATAADRDAYDGAVLDAVIAAGTPIGASAIRSIAGGTPLQARKSLSRLEAGGYVSASGKARATVYSPVLAQITHEVSEEAAE